MVDPRLTSAVLLAAVLGPAAAQTGPNWIAVARQIGGPGTLEDGRYVRLVPSRGWPGASPRIWIELRRTGRDAAELRGTIPVLGDVAGPARAALVAALPAGAQVVVRDSLGASSPKKQVWLLADGRPAALAAALRTALERIEPGALARIDTVGVVREDTFECETKLVVHDLAGERIDAGPLPAGLARAGQPVHLVARRLAGGPSEFLYYGVAGCWWTRAKAVEVRATAPLRVAPAPVREGPRWFARCREHARALLAGGGHTTRVRARPLATGFETLRDPGHKACPRCRRAMAKDWLTDRALERVDATLHCCARDGLYFLGRDGFGHGPFFPGDEREEKRK